MPKRKTDFIIAGAEFSGAEKLAEILREHPEIGIAQTDFFAQRTHFRRGKPNYSIFHSHFGKISSRKSIGELAPSYLYWPTILQRLHDYNPDLKIIAVFCNPILRTHRHWSAARLAGTEDFSLTDALNAELFRGRERKPNSNGGAYLYRGFYAEQLERLWQFFPKTQTLVLRENEWHSLQSLKSVCRFLGVGEFQQLPSKENSSEKLEPINADERQFLKSMFAPEIKKMESLFDWDCGDWLNKLQK